MLHTEKTGAAYKFRNWIMACFTTAFLMTGVSLLFPAPAEAKPDISTASLMSGDIQQA